MSSAPPLCPVVSSMADSTPTQDELLRTLCDEREMGPFMKLLLKRFGPEEAGRLLAKDSRMTEQLKTYVIQEEP